MTIPAPMLLTAPTVEPVTADSVRMALRIDDDRFDEQLPGLITAAREVAEHETGRRLVQQTWRYSLTDWPCADDLLPELQPSAVAVAYWTGSAWTTLATNAYVWAPAGPALASIALVPALNTSWPTLGSVAIGPRVRVDVTVGVDPVAVRSVPQSIQTFIVAIVGQVIQSPELTAAQVLEASPLLGNMLQPHRLYR
jgi:uncharacterized phiE125 gp8 family phage protein